MQVTQQAGNDDDRIDQKALDALRLLEQMVERAVRRRRSAEKRDGS